MNKSKIKKLKTNGYTLIELMGVISIIGTVSFLIVQQINQVDQMTFATRLATETLGYSKMANRFINNRYQDR